MFIQGCCICSRVNHMLSTLRVGHLGFHERYLSLSLSLLCLSCPSCFSICLCLCYACIAQQFCYFFCDEFELEAKSSLFAIW
jgi:hypothetical protein